MLCFAVAEFRPLSATAETPLCFNGIFGDNMILQRDKPVRIWGYGGREGETVTVSFSGQTKTARIDADGWEVYLDPLPADGEGQTLTAESEGERLEIENVAVGEVLFCSGQSNVAITVQYVINKYPEAVEEYRTYDNYADIRLYTPVWGGEEEETIYTAPHSAWKQPSRIQDILYCSAFASGLALNVQAKIGGNVPVGVIETSTGGSCIEEWLSADTLSALATHNASQSIYYNGMVSFLKGMTLNGVFWYQGEACIDYTEQHEEELAALIRQCRTDFANEDLSVYVMQLPQVNAMRAYGRAEAEEGWVKMRDVQQRISERFENVFTVCLADTGDASDDSDCIHPADKWRVGERAANAFVATALGTGDFSEGENPGISPKVISAELLDGEILLTTSSPVSSSDSVQGFSVKTSDGKVHSLVFSSEGRTLKANFIGRAVSLNYLKTAAFSFSLLADDFGLPLMPVREMPVSDNRSMLEVTFWDGDVVIGSQHVKYGDCVQRTEPSKEGAVFNGWYADSVLSDSFDFSSPVTADVAIYAKFTELNSGEDSSGEENSGCASVTSVISGIVAAAILFWASFYKRQD